VTETPGTTIGSKQPPPQVVLLEMWAGYLVSRGLHVVAELGIADHLAQGLTTAGELAAATGANKNALQRVLRMLASRGVFAEEEPGCFRLTALSECLRSGTAGSLRDAICMYGEMHWRAVGSLLHSVMTGEPAFDHVAGSPAWEYLANHPDDGERFVRGMANISFFENEVIAHAYDFSPYRVVIDVGGGRGGFIAEVLKANPGLRGLLYDEPHVVKHVLDGWDDNDASRILRVCRQAMPSRGRLLSINAVAPDGGGYSQKDAAILLMDMVMLAGSRGRERTQNEFRDLYHQAGFALSRVIPTRSLLSIVEGVPA